MPLLLESAAPPLRHPRSAPSSPTTSTSPPTSPPTNGPALQPSMAAPSTPSGHAPHACCSASRRSDGRRKGPPRNAYCTPGPRPLFPRKLPTCWRMWRRGTAASRHAGAPAAEGAAELDEGRRLGGHCRARAARGSGNASAAPSSVGTAAVAAQSVSSTSSELSTPRARSAPPAPRLLLLRGASAAAMEQLSLPKHKRR